MSRSAKLKGLNLRYPIAWRDFLLRNTMRTGKLRNMMFKISRPSTARPHGPLWLTFETIGARKPCHLFQKSIPAARHGRPSTARPHGPLWRTSETIGVRNSCRLFQKSIPAARHGRPSTARPHGPLWRTSETIGVRNSCRLFQNSVHGPTPRPALVDFCNNRREESVPFVSKVHLSGPSRTSVTARSDELLKQSSSADL